MQVPDIVHVSLYIFQHSLTSVLNMLSIVAILKHRKLREHFNNILFTALFACHFFTSLLNITIEVLLLDASLSKQKINYAIFPRDFLYGVAVLYTITLCVDRSLSVRFPFAYQNVSWKYKTTCICLPVFTNILFTVWRELSTTSAYSFIMAFIFISVIGANIANLMLYRSVRRQCRAIAATLVVDNTIDRQQQQQQQPQQQQQQQQRHVIIKLSLKSLKLCICVASSFLLVVIPSAIIMLDRLETGDDKNSQSDKIEGSVGSSNIFLVILISSNGLLDVLIFLYFNKEARKKLLPLKVKVSTNTVGPTQTENVEL